MTEEEKAAQKAKPVATTPIPGTPWYVGYLISKLFYLFIAMFDYYIITQQIEKVLEKKYVKY